MGRCKSIQTFCVVLFALISGILIGINIKTVFTLPQPLSIPQAPLLFSYETQSTPPTRIGYAVSLIKCGDKQTTTAGLMDAALILRHSVHMTSVRNPSSKSKYDYKMYAIVHRQALECSAVLEQVGFELIIADPPIEAKDIQGDFLRSRIHREWCCGADEFVKLYAYSKIPETIVVHVDMDFAFMKPMDELFDAMLYDANSVEGQAARKRIAVETPSKSLPDRIDAFFTLDWPQVIPGRKAGFQAGFMVIRRNETVVEEIVDIIREGNYTEGFSRENGWHSSGHGAYVGAMAMQGLMSYYYELVRPEHAVELNQCQFNWMGMDVRYRAPPSFHPKRYPDQVGRCRNFKDECEDCMNVDLDLVKNVHYTVCRKPWNCVSEGYSDGLYPSGKKGAIDTRTGNLDQCMKVVKKWHDYRSDLERKLYNITKDESILSGTTGDYKQDVFQGHCTGEGGSNYLQIQGDQRTFENVPQIYQ